MVEQVYTLYQGVKLGQVAGVAAVGIAAGRCCWSNQQAVGYDFAIGCHSVHAILDVVCLTDGNAVHVDDVALEMGQRRLLAKQVTAARHTVFKRQRPHLHASVFVDQLVLGGVHLVYLQGIVHSVTRDMEHRLYHGPQLAGTIDMQGCRSPQHSEGGDETWQTVAMVSVEMGDEHAHDFGEMQPRASQLHLCALTAIHHHTLVMQLNHLSRGMMTKGGQSTATPQDMHIEIHAFLFFYL